MASIVVAGDTSGTVTLAAPAVAGTTTLTLPTTSGTVVVNSGAQTIEFADGSASTPSITNSGDTNTGMFFPAADTIAFAEGGTESMRLDSSGNVGIGTTSPSAKFHVANAGVSAQATFVGTTLSPYITVVGNSGTTILGNESNGGWVGTIGSQAFVFKTTDTERMRITSGGLVGINCNPTLSWLQVVQPSGSNSVAGRFQHPGNASYGVVMSLETTGGSDNPALSFKNNNGGSPVYYSINCASNGTLYFNSGGSENGFGTQRISFDASGNAYKGSGAGSWLSLSDERIKTNIEDVTGGLSRILQLRPRTFDYKQPDAHNGKIHEKGFIAQEIEAVYPNSVTETDFILEQDKQYFAEGEKAKAIGFNSEFYADLVKAIQEQQTIIETLKADIAELKTKVDK
jgi:hypothetical protein